MGFLFNKKQGMINNSDPLAMSAYGQYMPNFTNMNNLVMPSFTQGMNNPVYQGETYAPMDPMMRNALSGMGTFGSQATQLGGNNLNATAGYGDAFRNTNQMLDDRFGAMNMGNSFADSAIAQNMIDASTRDIGRDLYENALPGADRRAMGSGNLNSNRAGIESAVLQRGAQDRAADVGAGIRSNMFNAGVGQYNTNIGQRFAGANALMGANNNAFNMGQGGLGMMAAGGQGVFDYNQGANDNAQAQYYAQFNNPMQLAGQYKDLLTPFTGFSGGGGGAKGYENNSNADNIARLLTLGMGFGF